MRLSMIMELVINNNFTFDYRASQVKLEETKKLFLTENMQIFLVKWYFYNQNGGMV